MFFPLLALFLPHIQACTDILVTPGSSTDGSAIIAYNADSPTLFGSIYHYPTSTSSSGEVRQVYDWDSGVYLGVIPEAAETYNVIGNGNEHGLVIGESTFGGIRPLAYNQTGAIIDYGSLIYLTLQRAKTAREAIDVMVDLMDTYGYYSGGESFSIGDSTTGEVWMMEVIGRGSSFPDPKTGNAKLGAVWVAIRIPDGSIAAHANQARITTFRRDDPDNCLFAEDVVDVAVHYGLYPADADPLAFSFSDVFHPLTFIGARQGEARVWSLFSQLADTDGAFERYYESYASGANLTHRMPLYITPAHKVSVKTIMHLFMSHFEGTSLDGTVDVGAGIYGSPHRPRPLVWKHTDEKGDELLYHNERNLATPKTGWSFIASIRPFLPTPISVVMWYGMDDSSTAPRFPIYTSSRGVPQAFAGRGSQDGIVTGLLQFDLTKAFWVQNMVSNWVYSRWKDMYPLLKEHIDYYFQDWSNRVQEVDKYCQSVYEKATDMEVAKQTVVDHVTSFALSSGQEFNDGWLNVYGELFVQFRDFYNIIPSENAIGVDAKEPGLSQIVKERIVEETGDHYRVLDTDSDQPDVVHGEQPPLDVKATAIMR